MQTIAIIGAGKLGTSIAKGFRRAVSQIDLTIVLADPVQPADIPEVIYEFDNMCAAERADLILVAVKPQQLSGVLAGIKGVLREGQVLVSTVMGKSIDEITVEIDNKVPVIRIMPNIASETCEGITCIAWKEYNKQIEDLFVKIGPLVVIEEKLMNAATVMTGSAIAFAMQFVRGLMQGGIRLGFDSRTALMISKQIIKGTAALLEEGDHPGVLIDKVTTPSGCTIAGIAELERLGMASAIIEAVTQSYNVIDDRF